MIFVILFCSLTRLQYRQFLSFVVRLGANGIIDMSIVGVRKFVAGDGVGTLVVGCCVCIDGRGVLFLVFCWLIRGAMRMASGAVGSTDMVSVVRTLEVGIVFILQFDAVSVLEGGTSFIRAGVYLFRLSLWCLVRTLASELKILQRFLFSITLTGTIFLNISRGSVSAMIV